MPKTTPATINKALRAAGFADVTIYRAREGYYYFDDATAQIRSIYHHNLHHTTPEKIVEHVRDELTRIKEEGL